MTISPLTPPSTSPQQLASPIGSPPVTLRECYLQTCGRFYPTIQPRHDWDIVILGCRSFKDGSFYAYSDRYLESSYYTRFTEEQVENGSARAQLMQEATELLDKEEVSTGVCISLCCRFSWHMLT